MKLRLSMILLFAAATFVADTSAQSNRPEVRPDTKKNQRIPEAAPTPIPNTTPGTSSNSPQVEDGEIIKVTTQLVSVPVRVMDRKGRFIGGLGKENFKVFENGQEEEIALFSNENEPFTVALMLDMSYSTKFKIGEIQAAAIAFIDQLRPQDRVMVISFDGDVHVLCDASSDRKEIYRAIKATKIATGTSLYEALDLVINDRMRQIDGRKAVILFSDGVDTTSRRASDYSNLYDAMEMDALIYTIRYDTFADVQRLKNTPVIQPPAITIPTTQKTGLPFPASLPGIGTPSSQGTTAEEYEKAAEYLEQLAIRTGGRRYEATSLGNLADAYSKIASELREFYSVGYYPIEDRTAGKQTSVRVKVDQAGAVVRAREIYSTGKKNKAQ